MINRGYMHVHLKGKSGDIHENHYSLLNVVPYATLPNQLPHPP